MWLKYDEEKGTVCEWCVEDKQTLVGQNVVNSNRFVNGYNSYKTESILQYKLMTAKTERWEGGWV